MFDLILIRELALLRAVELARAAERERHLRGKGTEPPSPAHAGVRPSIAIDTRKALRYASDVR